MANSDITLQNKDELDIYPITRERNVYDENNINLKTKFESVVFKNDDIYVFAEEEKLKNESMINTNQFKKLAASSVDIKEDYNLIRVTAKGTYAYADYYLDNLEVGETYTIGLDASTLDLSTRPRIFIGSKATASDNSYRTFSLDQTNNHRISLTFEATTNILNLTLYINTTTVVENNFIEISKITLAKGNKDIPYVGEIVRTEDVEQKFLKKEYEKTINLFDKNNLIKIGDGYIGISSKIITYNANVPAYCFKCKPNKTYTISKTAGKYFRVATYSNIPIIGETVGLQAIGNDEGSSITITTESNANYFVFNIHNSGSDTLTLQQMLDGLQIEEGSVATPYQPYNQSSHITNSQAYFLKSEHDKSMNEVNIPDEGVTTQRGIDYSSIKGAITLNGTATTTFSTEYDINFKSSNGCVLCAFNNLKYDETDNGYIQLRRKGGNYADYVDFKQINNFKVISGEVEFDKIRVVVATGYSVNNLVVKPMLVKGDVIPPEYQEWNGYPLHPKDIEPVPLWENATPTAEFTEVDTDITTVNRTGYKRLRLWYSDTVGNLYKYIDVPNISNNGCFLSAVVDYSGEDQHLISRSFTMSKTYPTIMRFKNAYENGIINNKRLVPVKLEGYLY